MLGAALTIAGGAWLTGAAWDYFTSEADREAHGFGWGLAVSAALVGVALLLGGLATLRAVVRR